MTFHDDSQAVSDARATRQLVLSKVLELAGKVIDKIEQDDELDFAMVKEELPSGGFTWRLSASTGQTNDFVRVIGEPDATEQGPIVPPHVMAAIMGNQSASFDFQVPKEWVRLAQKSTNVPFGVALSEAKAGEPLHVKLTSGETVRAVFETGPTVPVIPYEDRGGERS